MDNLLGGGSGSLALLGDINALKKQTERLLTNNYPINEYPNIWDVPSGFYALTGAISLKLEGIPSELKKNQRSYLLKGNKTDQSFCAVFSPAQKAMYAGYLYGTTKIWQKITGTVVT